MCVFLEQLVDAFQNGNRISAGFRLHATPAVVQEKRKEISELLSSLIRNATL